MSTLIGTSYDALRQLVVYGQPFLGLTLHWTTDPAGRTFVCRMVGWTLYSGIVRVFSDWPPCVGYFRKFR